MIYKRYKDADKLIVDADGLKLSDIMKISGMMTF